MPEVASVATAWRRDRIVIWTCLIVLTAASWLYLFRLERGLTASMEYDTAMAAMGMARDSRWSAADVWFTFVMWLVMMVGMMSAAAAPVFLLFASTAARRSQRRLPVSVWPCTRRRCSHRQCERRARALPAEFFSSPAPTS